MLRGPRSAFCLDAATCALSRSASSDVPEGYVHPCFTAWTLGGHVAGGPIHADDRVLHDHLTRPGHDDLGRADLAAGGGSYGGLGGQRLMHGRNSTIPTGYVKN